MSLSPASPMLTHTQIWGAIDALATIQAPTVCLRVIDQPAEFAPPG